MKNYFLFIITIASCHFIFSQNVAKEKQQIQEFIDFVNQQQFDSIMQNAQYPILRPYPLENIEDEDQFVEVYRHVFDKNLNELLQNSNINSDWQITENQGILFQNGLIILDYNGELMAINYESDQEKTYVELFMQKDQANLYKSLRDYQKPLLSFTFPNLQIRVDQLKDGKYRYVSWDVGQDPSQAPKIVLDNGSVELEGTTGNPIYTFENEGFKYVVYSNRLHGAGQSPGSLSITYNGDLFYNQDAINKVANNEGAAPYGGSPFFN